MLSTRCTSQGLPRNMNMLSSGSPSHSRSTGRAPSTHSRSPYVSWVEYCPHTTFHTTPCLEKAIDLADRIMPILATPSGIPLSFVDLEKGIGLSDEPNNGLSSLSEAATLQLELKYLSHLTDDYTYWRAAEKARHCAFPVMKV